MRQFNLFNRMKIFSLLLIFVLFFLPDVFSQVNTWQSKQAFGGTGRSGAVAFSIGTKGYIGTGYDIWEQDYVIVCVRTQKTSGSMILQQMFGLARLILPDHQGM